MTVLFPVGCPSTVPRLVVPRRVKSVYRVSTSGPRSHVSKKCLKRVQPSVAHFYATPAIEGELAGLRVIATTFHSDPRSVCRRVALLVRRNRFIPKTSARSCKAVAQLSRIDDDTVAAIAQTDPVCPSELYVGAVQVGDHQPPKASAAPILHVSREFTVSDVGRSSDSFEGAVHGGQDMVLHTGGQD